MLKVDSFGTANNGSANRLANGNRLANVDVATTVPAPADGPPPRAQTRRARARGRNPTTLQALYAYLRTQSIFAKPAEEIALTLHKAGITVVEAQRYCDGWIARLQAEDPTLNPSQVTARLVTRLQAGLFDPTADAARLAAVTHAADLAELQAYATPLPAIAPDAGVNMPTATESPLHTVWQCAYQALEARTPRELYRQFWGSDCVAQDADGTYVIAMRPPVNVAWLNRQAGTLVARTLGEYVTEGRATQVRFVQHGDALTPPAPSAAPVYTRVTEVQRVWTQLLTALATEVEAAAVTALRAGLTPLGVNGDGRTVVFQVTAGATLHEVISDPEVLAEVMAEVAADLAITGLDGVRFVPAPA